MDVRTECNPIFILNQSPFYKISVRYTYAWIRGVFFALLFFSHHSFCRNTFRFVSFRCISRQFIGRPNHTSHRTPLDCCNCLFFFYISFGWMSLLLVAMTSWPQITLYHWQNEFLFIAIPCFFIFRLVNFLFLLALSLCAKIEICASNAENVDRLLCVVTNSCRCRFIKRLRSFESMQFGWDSRNSCVT